MASRLGLARIIDWGRACDREELAYVLVRLTRIMQERNAREAEVLLPGKVKRTARTRRTKEQIIADENAQHVENQQAISA